MSKLNRREIIMEAVGDSVMTDVLNPQSIANWQVLTINQQESVQAWAAGAAAVHDLIKADDRRMVVDQLWRFCASPEQYPLELRTVYGGSDHSHSAEVLDWALPSLAIASAMQKYGISPRVSILSADLASSRINGLSEDSVRRYGAQTLALVTRVVGRYYPDVDLEVRHLSWEELTQRPYEQDVERLRAKEIGSGTRKIVQDLEAMVARRGGDVNSVARYLGLHNTAYGIYSGRPVVKLAGKSEARFNAVQSELAVNHPGLIGCKDINGNPIMVAATIQGSSSAAPYYVRTGTSVEEMLDDTNESDYSLSELAVRYNLGKVATKVAELTDREMLV